MQKGIFRQNDSLWVEKYRPQALNEYIGNKEVKEKFEDFIKTQDIPNLLLEGPPGCGKTSMANILIKHINCDYKYINASSENNMETVRTTIMNFCTTSGFSSLKIMICDEFEQMSFSAQAALRSIMEQFSKTCRFILTCNFVEKVIDPIKSRCQTFTIISPSKEQIKRKTEYILRTEEVEYDGEELNTIINNLYPDVRKIIGTLQQLTTNKVLKLSKEFFLIQNTQTRLVDIFNKSTESNLYDNVTEIRQLLADARIKTFNEIYRYLYDNIDLYKRNDSKIIPIIVSLARTQYNDAMIVDKEINVVAGMIELLEILTK